MICLLAAGVAIPLGTADLTLRWTHSVEKVVWEEHWEEAGADLILTTARVQGSGAGMEPGPDARLVGGAWTWTPRVPPVREVILRRSGATTDWSVCIAGACRSFGRIVKRSVDPVVMSVCPAATRRAPASATPARKRAEIR